MRREVRDNVWVTMLERWEHQADGYHELPIMWPRLSRWWPWHPAVIAAVVLVLVLVAVWVGP